MDIDDIKELMVAMSRNRISCLKIKKRFFSLEMSSSSSHAKMVDVDTSDVDLIGDTDKPKEKVEITDNHSSVDVIYAPMVGTYLSSISNGGEPFVKVGDSITEDSIICIIEAMKVRNEIKAGKCGKITKIHVNDGEVVDCNSTLMSIKVK